MAADQEPSASSTDAEMEVSSTPIDKEESIKIATNALVQGKRHLLVKDIASAIASLGEACRLTTEVYGPVAPENAEAHFYYGKALLEQSRLDLAVFEGPECAKAESEADESEDQEEESEEDNEAEAEVNGEEGKAEGDADEKKEEADGDKAETETESKDMEVEGSVGVDEKIAENGKPEEEDLNVPSPSTAKITMEPSEEKPSTSKDILQPEAVDPEAEEELGNLQLAWEVLEVAKVAFERKLEELSGEVVKDDKTEGADEERSKQIKELQKKLADTHLLLGEVATESEMYVEAVQEFKTGLMLLQKIEEPDSREIAQYYFQIGLAYAFGKSFQDAISSFKMSMEIIERRIVNLMEKKGQQILSGTEKKEGDATEEVEQSSEEREIEELKALLPELQEKINDTIDAENDSKKTKEEETKEQEIIMRNSPVKNPNPPIANDISHLVKKRKKPEESAEVEPPSKRVCNLFPQQDDVSSSTPTTTNGNTNVSA